MYTFQYYLELHFSNRYMKIDEDDVIVHCFSLNTFMPGYGTSSSPVNWDSRKAVLILTEKCSTQLTPDITYCFPVLPKMSDWQPMVFTKDGQVFMY
jgi:hypothetical protein